MCTCVNICVSMKSTYEWTQMLKFIVTLYDPDLIVLFKIIL